MLTGLLGLFGSTPGLLVGNGFYRQNNNKIRLKGFLQIKFDLQEVDTF